MRADEGDESVKDYAKEGRQTMGKIKDSQRAGNPLAKAARRFTGLFRADRDK